RALVAEAAGQPVAAGRERGTRRLVRGGHLHRVRDRTRARVLVVLDGEGDGVAAALAVGVRRVLGRRPRGPVAEGPLPASDRAIGLAALVAEAAGEPGAAGRERGTRRLVRGGHLHRVRDRTRARVLIVLDGEGDGVGARRAVGVRRVLGRRPRGPVAEGPLPARDRAIGIAALVAEAAGEPVAAGRERRVHVQLPSGSLLWSLKLQASPLQLDVNAALGGWFGAVTCTVCETGLELAFWLSLTVRVTV